MHTNLKYSRVAQSVEQRPVKAMVVGSSPAPGEMIYAGMVLMSMLGRRGAPLFAKPGVPVSSLDACAKQMRQ